MIVTAYRPRLEMSPLSVYCTACHAKFGSRCTTMNGHQRLPHAPREKLAGNPLPCPSCGAGYGEPCRKASGALSLYPHRARLRVRAEARGNQMVRSQLHRIRRAGPGEVPVRPGQRQRP